MVNEAYDSKGVKYKVGMEVMIPGGPDLWYITRIDLGEDNKVGKLYLINSKLDMFDMISNLRMVTLTGYFKPEFLKIAKDIDKREYWDVKKGLK